MNEDEIFIVKPGETEGEPINTWIKRTQDESVGNVLLGLNRIAEMLDWVYQFGARSIQPENNRLSTEPDDNDVWQGTRCIVAQEMVRLLCDSHQPFWGDFQTVIAQEQSDVERPNEIKGLRVGLDAFRGFWPLAGLVEENK